MKAAAFLAGACGGIVVGFAGAYLLLGAVALEFEKNRRYFRE